MDRTSRTLKRSMRATWSAARTHVIMRAICFGSWARTFHNVSDSTPPEMFKISLTFPGDSEYLQVRWFYQKFSSFINKLIMLISQSLIDFPNIVKSISVGNKYRYGLISRVDSSTSTIIHAFYWSHYTYHCCTLKLGLKATEPTRSW